MTTYVIYDRDMIEDVPHVMVYVSNEEGESGYVIGDLDGNVLQTTKPRRGPYDTSPGLVTGASAPSSTTGQRRRGRSPASAGRSRPS